MAQTHENVMFNPSSPHSSVGAADSFKGTPDTRLTAFSPEESATRSSRLLKSIVQASPETTPSRFPSSAFGNVLSSAEKDPFITTSSNTCHQKLSPTASTFQPFSSPLDKNAEFAILDRDRQSASSVFPTGVRDVGELSECLIIGSKNRNIGITDLNTCLVKLQRLGLSLQEPRQIFHRGGRISVQFSDIRDAVLVHDNVYRVEADFEIDYLSNVDFSELAIRNRVKSGAWVAIVALAIPPCPLDVIRTEAVLKRMLQSRGQLSAYHAQQKNDPSVYRAIIQFSDQAEAATAVVMFNNIIVEVSSSSAGKLHGDNVGSELIIFKGIHITLSLLDENEIPHAAQDPQDGPTDDHSPTTPRHDLTSALHALSLSNQANSMPLMPQGVSIPVPGSPYPPLGIQVSPLAMWPILCQPQFQPGTAYVLNDGQRLSPPTSTSDSARYQFTNHLFSQPSPSMPMMGSMSPGTRAEPRRQNAARVNRSPYYNVASHHNHVDVNRIREGTDVRTTVSDVLVLLDTQTDNAEIMLRNIPNKVDQAMLKRIVDESSWGKYDFMYLRIDFANDCNVGYAFINFVDPLDIIDFVNTRGNQRWNCFKSDKVAEISYATIQGKDCLVQKFRNSSVMLEATHYRPKLFYTCNGPVPELAGEEESFPEPDNQSKMKRSCENAEHVGLFTPNAGQHFRDEQRRRRSQYDRGTRLAALEEHDFEASMQPYMYHA
ncbi:RNA recognition domain-containing protein 2 [Colletotrichum abscissum]|uniref:RNA recognition domain-containing protein 2 n=3 Tax=Colletotrichum acutatum species complex TaxID=2707335 RepID=A0A9Q0B2U1_9PEZI|nr:RNA recognition domain-containing protein 2 [Colletotrichum costaricense]XP_060377352.1 RNA recognition domain-containing protein 2 [Colletotrichum tamarilloi]XP_060406038.1 RNA recognition domain-containing protein 2 [Colletotrichum abscissum]KAI3547220.1 RNA recognition domain-containing protein 2 [Colletotrichum abscissum]KAK1487001.1 RNA recognition domain-containing protein 2 [Colletotrichum tamarilloi]KAK1525052.1 RNA recognition domain-containing protein 2 [Colletotrichum abscissum]